MPLDTVNERRIFERFSARFPAKLKDSRQDYGTDIFLRDASASGARLVSKERMFLNDHVAIQVELPDGQSPMILNGTVVWSKPAPSAMWDIGMQFPQVSFMKMQRMFKFSAY